MPSSDSPQDPRDQQRVPKRQKQSHESSGKQDHGRIDRPVAQDAGAGGQAVDRPARTQHGELALAQQQQPAQKINDDDGNHQRMYILARQGPKPFACDTHAQGRSDKDQDDAPPYPSCHDTAQNGAPICLAQGGCCQTCRSAQTAPRAVRRAAALTAPGRL